MGIGDWGLWIGDFGLGIAGLGRMNKILLGKIYF